MQMVLVSCAPGEAEGLLEKLLGERLVGCGNIVPAVRSLYWWQGEICRDAEELLLMETAGERIAALMQRIQALHSYEVPKIISFQVDQSLPAYARWLVDSLATPTTEGS